MGTIKEIIATENLVIQNQTRAVTSSDKNVTINNTNAIDTGLIKLDTASSGLAITKGKDVTVDLSENITALELISDGALDISIDGGDAIKITGIDLDGVSTTAEVAEVLTDSLSALPVVVTEASDIITITSNTWGSSSEVEITAGTGAGTNIVDTGLIVMGTAVPGIEATSGKQTTDDISGNITAIKALTGASFNIAIDGKPVKQITGIDFSEATDTADVASIIATALADLPVTVTESSDVITITSNSTGSKSAVVITAASGDADGTFVICDALLDSTVVALDMNGETRTLFALQGEIKRIMLTRIVSTTATIIIGR